MRAHANNPKLMDKERPGTKEESLARARGAIYDSSFHLDDSSQHPSSRNVHGSSLTRDRERTHAESREMQFHPGFI